MPRDVPDFDIEEIFGALANEDYEGAVQLARGFQGEAPLTNATIAIARSVLNQKPARVPTRYLRVKIPQAGLARKVVFTTN